MQNQDREVRIIGTMEFVDTHCHIHGEDYELDPDAVISEAEREGVARMICVGTDGQDSRRAVEFVESRKNCWASIGLHPHDAKHSDRELSLIKTLAGQPKVVAIGECGLDYFYSHSPKEAQLKSLKWQFELAQEHRLPMIFHVRDAFDDFWPVYDGFPETRGVVHSFTATTKQLDEIIARGLYVGLNGIMTFTKDDDQLAAAKAIPLENMVLETDAPFLTPTPQRGKINEPRYVRLVAQFLAELRQEEPPVIAQATTDNAKALFNLE